MFRTTKRAMEWAQPTGVHLQTQVCSVLVIWVGLLSGCFGVVPFCAEFPLSMFLASTA